MATKPFRINIGNAISSDPAYNAQARYCVERHGCGYGCARRDRQCAVALHYQRNRWRLHLYGGLANIAAAGQYGDNQCGDHRSTEASVSPATLTFDSTNFDIPQTVTVNGIDDGIRDGDQNYQITLRIAPTSDPDYVNLRMPPISATNVDNGGAGIVISPASGLTTTGRRRYGYLQCALD